MSARYELTDDVREAFPDERETLKAVSYAAENLLNALMMGDETGLGWKNEISLSCFLDLGAKWLPLARERLGLAAVPPSREQRDT